MKKGKKVWDCKGAKNHQSKLIASVISTILERRRRSKKGSPKTARCIKAQPWVLLFNSALHTNTSRIHKTAPIPPGEKQQDNCWQNT